MRKRLLCMLCVFLLLTGLLSGCAKGNKTVHIGVSIGAGPAIRWGMEKGYMEDRARELNIVMDARLNQKDGNVTQEEECMELIDSGIDVLILMPRDVNAVDKILEYADQKGVSVVDYARAIDSDKVDMFIGYDCNRIGQAMGQYLAETVDSGDYIILKGDSADSNATFLYEGAMRYIEPIKDNIQIILETDIPGWSPDTAKQMVREAVSANGNHVDAILAPNDALAGACAEALAELGVTGHVVITGMDAELAAAKRIVAGTQDITFYMDLHEMAITAVDEAVHLAKGEKTGVNAEYPVENSQPLPSHLITGQMITDKNIDKYLIESGYLTREEIYE